MSRLIEICEWLKHSQRLSFYSICTRINQERGVRGVQIEITPLIWLQAAASRGRAGTLVLIWHSTLAPTPSSFLSHTLETASLGGRKFVMGWWTLLTTRLRRLGEMGTAKLSQSPLKEHDEDTAKKQHAGLVEARINNNRAPHCKTPCQEWDARFVFITLVNELITSLLITLCF